MEYRITKVGGHWVATNGAKSVEDASPDDALYGLLLGETEEEEGCGEFDAGPQAARKSRAAEKVGRSCVRLIQLLALDAPERVVVAEEELIRKHVDEWLGA